MGLFDGTKFERPVTCEVCGEPMSECRCPRDAGGKVLLPSQQRAIVRLEKRSKGKTVTLIEGLDPSAAGLGELLKALKSCCAAGGTLSGGVIVIQGDHREAAVSLLKGKGFKVAPAG